MGSRSPKEGDACLARRERETTDREREPRNWPGVGKKRRPERLVPAQTHRSSRRTGQLPRGMIGRGIKPLLRRLKGAKAVATAAGV